MRATEPHLLSRAIRPVVSGLAALGHDPAPILARAGVDPRLLDDPDAEIPMRAAVAVLADGAESTGDGNLGLHAAERAVHLYAMLASPTLGAAFACVSRYQRLINDTTHVELTLEGDHAVLRHLSPAGTAAPRQSAEFIVAAWVRAGRLATGTRWTPTEVRFAHPEPPDPTAHARFFGAPVRFGAAENALILPAALLDAPCLRADPALLAVLDRYAGDRLDRARPVTTLAERARAALAHDLHEREPSSARLARTLKMSVRTLNRALAAEGTSYREILEQLRRELSARHLADPRIAISEIAFLLGFSELSAFHRAFKRWNGITPAEYRRTRLAR